jgi:hypothetical protein
MSKFGKYELLTVDSPKTRKGESIGYLTGVLYLAPYDSAGVGNVCPWASVGCVATCLNTAGRGGIIAKGQTTNVIQEARKRRTRAFFAHRGEFIATLYRDIDKLRIRAQREGMRVSVRLNGTSDLRFDAFAVQLFRAFPDVQFYDYTKDPNKLRDYVAGKTPANYHLTFSYSESANMADIAFALSNRVNVAVVFTGRPDVHFGGVAGGKRADRFMIDGDAHDLRFIDPKIGALVMLTAKGKAKRDASGFVVRY